MDYQTFLENKKHSIGNFGFKANYYPDIAFDFQKHIIEKATLKGRIAIFADTGLGKTLIQLSIAKNIIQHTNKKVLILTPLAVAFQFILEAEKLGIDDIEYSKDGKLNQRPKQLFNEWVKAGNKLWDEMLKSNQVNEEYLDSISDIYHNINLEIKKNIV